MRTGRPPLPRGALGQIRVEKQVQDGKHKSGNLRWRTATPEDEGFRVRWHAIAGYRDKTGKKRRLSRYSEVSAAAARRALQSAWADQLEQQKLQRPRSRSKVSDLANQWWADFKETSPVLEQTKDQYKDTLDDFVLPTFGDLRVYELDSASIYDGLEALAEGALGRARMSRVVLKHICTYAVRIGVLDKNPVTKDIPTYKAKTRAPGSLTSADYRDVRQAVIAWQSGNRYGPQRSTVVLDVLDFMMATGCRVGEALAVRWEDVELGDAPSVTFSGTILEPRSGKPTRRQPFTKTAAGFRKVPIGRTTAALLMRRAGEEVLNDHNLVFPNASGGYLSTSGFRFKLRQALKEAGLEGFYPTLTRKTSARQIRDAVSLEAASATLGHSNTSVTAQHYAGMIHDAPDVSDVMENFLKAALE